LVPDRGPQARRHLAGRHAPRGFAILARRIAAALVQQFRRYKKFFAVCEKAVPGLNELGKKIRVEKNLGFAWEDEVLPLTQLTINYRINIEEWDSALEEQLRTTEDPFEKTLAALEEIVTSISAVDDDGIEQDTLPLSTVKVA
jgi:hypothetical protein